MYIYLQYKSYIFTNIDRLYDQMLDNFYSNLVKYKKIIKSNINK